MILTLTLNPAIDQTLWVDRMTIGAVNRPSATQLDPAGKGINVSRMAHRLGWPTFAFGFLGGDIGNMIQNALDQEGVHNHFVRIVGQTRINVTLIDSSSDKATSFYGPGPAVTAASLKELDEMIAIWMKVGRVLVLAGSLLPGVPPTAYARYIDAARQAGVKTILDADGDSLRLGIEARPDLIKPNVEEAERLLGRPLKGINQIIEGAAELSARGIHTVIISMGGDGAIAYHAGQAWHIIPPKIHRLSTVGSGDSLIAGLAVELARSGDLLAGLRLGTAAGAATAMCPGTALGTIEDVNRLLPEVKLTPVRAIAA